jgi:cell division protein FtsB
MNIFTDQLHKLRQKLTDKGLLDVRLFALAGVGFIALSVFWNGAKIVQQNFELSQKVAAIEQENKILDQENQILELRNQYLSTDEFAELTARRVFGRAAPGEQVFIVPKDVALSAVTSVKEDPKEPLQVIKPQYQQNLEKWLDIYFGN